MKPIHTFLQHFFRKHSSTFCNHKKLILLPDRRYRLRCRRCHRLLPPETAETACCPGCFENDGLKRYDFSETNIIDVSFALYQCEDCGLMIHRG